MQVKSILSTFLFIFLITVPLTKSKAQEQIPFFDLWSSFKEERIKDRLFKHEDLIPMVKAYSTLPDFEVSQIGYSFEGREILLLKIGHGDTPILLWSQMHGDEPTATMAILDVCKFFAQSDSLDYFKNKIKNELSIYIIPMLNPDGAQIYKRRNALDIDLNRDAMMLESPESKILKQVRDSLNPKFGFNLHDQSAYYTAGAENKPAVISFLAPAYNEAKDINDVRANAMRLIQIMNRLVQSKLPGNVGRYNDTFEPRAFGDNMQLWGTSTILIESGYLPGDPEKQYNRQLHFAMFLDAFQNIANKRYLFESLHEYHDIPFNQRRAHDLIVRGLKYPYQQKFPVIDVSWQRTETFNSDYRKGYYKATISDIGDLSTMWGFEELDASQYEYVAGKILKGAWKDMQNMKVIDIIRSGHSWVLAKSQPDQESASKLPLQIILHERDFKNEIKISRNPGFFLHMNGQAKIYIHNGIKYELDELANILGEKTLADYY